MTKKDIVIELAKRFNLTQVETKQIVQGTFDAIIEVLADQGRIELRNFGVFEVKRRASRKSRNPKTGEEVEVPEKLVVQFKPGRRMEERVATTDEPLDPEGQALTAVRALDEGPRGHHDRASLTSRRAAHHDGARLQSDPAFDGQQGPRSEEE